MGSVSGQMEAAALLGIPGAELTLEYDSVPVLKKHLRRTRDNPKGGIATMEGTVHLSNLMLVCPHCSKPARIGFTHLSDGSKKRICKRCQEIVA